MIRQYAPDIAEYFPIVLWIAGEIIVARDISLLEIKPVRDAQRLLRRNGRMAHLDAEWNAGHASLARADNGLSLVHSGGRFRGSVDRDPYCCGLVGIEPER